MRLGMFTAILPVPIMVMIVSDESGQALGGAVVTAVVANVRSGQVLLPW